MAKCPGCGSDTPAAARFCPLCGRTVATPAAPAPGVAMGPASARGLSDPADSSSDPAGKRKILLASAAAVALVLIGAVLFAGARSGVLSAQRSSVPATGVLTAPSAQTPQAPVLTAPAPTAPSAPVIQAPQTAQNPMPEDVVAYLRWLRQFEAYRHGLEKQGFSVLAVWATTQTFNNPFFQELLKGDPTEPSPAPRQPNPRDTTIGKVIQDWNQSTRVFQQRTPPNPCAPLAGYYNQALTLGVQRMVAVQQLIPPQDAEDRMDQQQASEKINQALSLLSGSGEVDMALANANQALNELRGRYTSMPEDVRTFDIKAYQAPFDPKRLIPPM